MLGIAAHSIYRLSIQDGKWVNTAKDQRPIGVIKEIAPGKHFLANVVFLCAGSVCFDANS